MMDAHVAMSPGRLHVHATMLSPQISNIQPLPFNVKSPIWGSHFGVPLGTERCLNQSCIQII